MLNHSLHLSLAQCNFTVGDIEGNGEKIIQSARQAIRQSGATIIAYPELALIGYPPEDLLLRNDFSARIQLTLEKIATILPEALLIIGYPEHTNLGIFNSAAILTEGKIIANYRKQVLPNYGVFDEKRYFQSGNQPCIIKHHNISFGILICEDLWFKKPAQEAKEAGAEILIVLNASPFDDKKLEKRFNTAQARIKETGLPILWVNQVGGQDDLIFDGTSFAMNKQGELIAHAKFAKEDILDIILQLPNYHLASINPPKEFLTREQQIYDCLVLGTRDYVKKNKFTQVLLGLSGGIDSALTLTIAVDAFGKENVLPVLLPSRFTSALSLDLAHAQLKNLDINYQEISIEPSFKAFLQSLRIDPQQPPNNLTIQNIQARCRGVILMALSNQTNALLLNTSNKSETAVGYGTLYGDIAGAYAVLKDVWKTDVYALANYRNQKSTIIPEEVISRPPSAELALNQRDEDSLPPYSLLDAILKSYVEENKSIQEIISLGFEEKTVRRIIKLVNINEYKRRQSPLGPRVSICAFGRERRYPITSSYACERSNS